MSTEPKQELAIVVTPRLLWALGSALAIIVGSLGPWITWGAISVSGTGDGRDGTFTLILGVVALVLVGLKRARLVVALLAAAALAVALMDGVDIARSVDTEDSIFGSIEIGWGLIVLALGAASLLAWAITEYLAHGKSRGRLWAVAATSLAVVVLGAVLGATGSADAVGDESEASESKAATGETTEPGAEPDTKPTCDSLGISLGTGREGKCVDENGWRVNVANRDSRLALDDLEARVMDMQVAETVDDLGGEPVSASGYFLSVTLEVRNTSRAPIDVSPSLFLLRAGDTVNEPDTSLFVEGALGDERLGPELSETGDLIFDLAPSVVAGAMTNGNLIVFQPSDTGAPQSPTKTVGFIRTYASSNAAGSGDGEAGGEWTPCPPDAVQPPAKYFAAASDFAIVGDYLDCPIVVMLAAKVATNFAGSGERPATVALGDGAGRRKLSCTYDDRPYGASRATCEGMYRFVFSGGGE